MSNELMDLNARIAVAENEIKTMRCCMTNLENEHNMNTATINEIKITLVKHTVQNENLINRLTDNVVSLNKTNDKILDKLGNFDNKINSQNLTNNKLSFKTKIMWTLMIFILSSFGSLIFSILERKIIK